MNAKSTALPQVDPSSVAADQLKTIIERIERLEEEKAGIAGDIKDVYAEAKANGFDTKIIRKIIGLRKRDYDERMEEEAILELYMQALGMLADTPLGKAAIDRETSRARASERGLRQQIGQKLSDAFAGMEGVTVTIGRDAGPVMREAARKMRAAGAQVDLEDAIAARG
ncbi:hypothetical protein BGCPKDLD_4347 [Methylorubrum suomiense]|uniref:UPF0335 protein BGCPKDLD_4347 n=1 Tax=Methylorubrum suomiense TaxID=144191 RepID=A0ABQ4V0Z1_9HYPH|nr:hypothetical protein BGCPKDLD_4347 [Methylorubrum suomiense]